jgi:Domain of unknown function (DUF4158)
MGFVIQMVPGKAEVRPRTGRTWACRQRSQGPSGRENRGRRSIRHALGLAVAVCTLPWLGFVPDEVASAPQAAVVRLAEQLHVDPAAQYLGWRAPTTMELKELDEFLLARAMEHDSPTLLFRLASEYLISARVIRQGPVTVVKRVAHAREVARQETFDRLAHEFTNERRAGLDGLLVVDSGIGMTRCGGWARGR